MIISAGAGQKPGETRLDLVNKNVAIFKSIIPEITKRDFPFSILATVALGIALVSGLIISGSPTVNRFDGICFIVIFAIYIFMLIRSAMASRKNSTNEEVVIHNHSVPTSLIFYCHRTCRCNYWW